MWCKKEIECDCRLVTWSMSACTCLRSCVLPTSCTPSFPSPLLSFFPPFLALPLLLSFLWIASLLILIAYALPCLSYLLTCSFHIWRRSVRPCLVVVLEHPT